MSRREVTGRKPGVSADHETTEPAVAALLPTASADASLGLDDPAVLRGVQHQRSVLLQAEEAGTRSARDGGGRAKADFD